MQKSKFTLGMVIGALITCVVAFNTPHKVVMDDVYSLALKECKADNIKSFKIYLFGKIKDVECIKHNKE